MPESPNERMRRQRPEQALERLRRRVAEGTLTIRQATPEERAAWPPPRPSPRKRWPREPEPELEAEGDADLEGSRANSRGTALSEAAVGTRSHDSDLEPHDPVAKGDG
jgi:hypothetical protein